MLGSVLGSHCSLTESGPNTSVLMLVGGSGIPDVQIIINLKYKIIQNSDKFYKYFISTYHVSAVCLLFQYTPLCFNIESIGSDKLCAYGTVWANRLEGFFVLETHLPLSTVICASCAL